MAFRRSPADSQTSNESIMPPGTPLRMVSPIRPLLADGLSNVVGSALGVPGMSIGPSLVGVSGATGATSRVIGFAASIVLLVFAFSPRLSGFFLLVPQEVAGSLLVLNLSLMMSSRMSN